MVTESQQNHRPESQPNHRIVIFKILELAERWQSQDELLACDSKTDPVSGALSAMSYLSTTNLRTTPRLMQMTRCCPNCILWQASSACLHPGSCKCPELSKESMSDDCLARRRDACLTHVEMLSGSSAAQLCRHAIAVFRKVGLPTLGPDTPGAEPWLKLAGVVVRVVLSGCKESPGINQHRALWSTRRRRTGVLGLRAGAVVAAVAGAVAGEGAGAAARRCRCRQKLGAVRI